MPLVQNDKGLHRLVAHRVVHADDGAFGYGRVHQERVFHLGGRHVLTASLDHVAFSIDEIEPAFLIAVAFVAAEVPALPIHGSRRGLGIVVVALHETDAGNTPHGDLPYRPRRHRPSLLVQDLHLVAKARPPHARPTARAIGQVGERPADGLRRAVAVLQTHGEAALEGLLLLIGDGQVVLHRPDAVLSLGGVARLHHEGAGHHRHELDGRDSMLAHLAPEVARAVLLQHDETGARREHGHEGRQLEVRVEGGHGGKHAVLRPQGALPIAVVAGEEHVRMGDLHTLGARGGAGGEDDHGRVLAVQIAPLVQHVSARIYPGVEVHGTGDEPLPTAVADEHALHRIDAPLSTGVVRARGHGVGEIVALAIRLADDGADGAAVELEGALAEDELHVDGHRHCPDLR